MSVALLFFSLLVPSILFSGDCSENHVALVASIYDEFPDPGRKNPVSIPINKMRLDSKIIEAEVASVPKFANKQQLFECKPDIKLLLRSSSPHVFTIPDSYEFFSRIFSRIFFKIFLFSTRQKFSIEIKRS